MSNQIFDIEGMHCAACASNIERRVSKLEGVKSASVNLATEKLSVELEKDITHSEEIFEHIITTIDQIGFKADFEQEDKHQKDADKNVRTMWLRFYTAAAFTIPLLVIAMGPMVGLALPAFLDGPAFAIVQMLLSIPVMIAGYSFYTVGIPALFRRLPNMDSLVAIGTLAAFGYSLFSTYMVLQGEHSYLHSLYFESAATIITLILLGKTLESISKGKSSAAIKKLMGLSPKTALVKRDDGKEVETLIKHVKVGDKIIVKAGGAIPVDGIVIYGQSSVDESLLSGESLAVPKVEGSSVYSATINNEGLLIIEATKVGKDTALAQIIKLVEDAQSKKAPIARLADVISGYFVPIVFVIAALTLIVWLSLGKGVEFSLSSAVAVLVIACPCALGLATPTAIMVATGRAAELGILIKSGEALQEAGKAEVVVLDKTGTITKGKPEVAHYVSAGELEKDEVLTLAYRVEKASDHPLAAALVAYAEKHVGEADPSPQAASSTLANVEAATDVVTLPGFGLQASVAKSEVLIGNPRLLRDRGIDTSALQEDIESASSKGQTPVLLAVNNIAAGLFLISDLEKEDSHEAIAKLKAQGIRVVMLTGDIESTAKAIAARVGIDEVVAEVLPQDKAKVIQDLKDEGNIVAFVGDGINDAPALVVADIGIAIGSGTDVAIESADIVLMHDSLNDVVAALDLSKRSMRIIKQNLFWAFAYNVAGIPIAAGLLYAFGGPLLSPMFAAAAMSISSVTVVTNALRLRR